MGEIGEAFRLALGMLASGDADLFEIVGLSLQVSGTALLIAAVIGLPLGAVLGGTRFVGRRAVIVLLNALLGLPPVVVGLLVYLVISRSGPLGSLGLLFTPTAMVIAQVVLVTPIVAAVARQTIDDLYGEYDEQLRSLCVGPLRTVLTLLYEARFRLLTALLAGLGRAVSEVGAVMIVGGNIAHLTRVMTTAIALETSRGDLAMALALGIILIAISLTLNAAAQIGQGLVQRAG